ncbi:MAG: phosphoglycerate dehydrogenase [bacterium]|nr:phosphoglycerate dehydrogenase [bacterium]MDT8396208.1 phosphoglycerate dehydrogenase [bacterium]
MKVLITDTIDQEGIDILTAEEGMEVVEDYSLKGSGLAGAIGPYHALITRSGTNVTADVIDKADNLKVIGRAGVGVDNVDIEAASRRGIIVMNAPTGNTLAATEHTLAMMLAAVRKLPFAHNSLEGGQWDRKKFVGIQLYKRTLGIVGLGRIGSEVAKRATSFGMRIVAYDPYIKREKAEKIGVELVDNIEDLLAVSDIVTFHVPLTDETTSMIGTREVALMKDRVVLVNCARGGIIAESVLADALKSGKVYMAAVDVFAEEPLPADSPLHGLPNLIVTPHLGANTEEAQKNVSVIIAQQVVNVLKGRSYENAVNLPYVRGKLAPELQAYFDLAEKMGRLLSQFTIGRIEEVQVTLVGPLFAEDVTEKVFDCPFRYQPYTFAMLKGLIELRQQEGATYISAPYYARERGMSIVEAKADRVKNYSDLITVRVITDRGANTMEGTVFADLKGRIITIDQFRVDLVAEGTFLFFSNQDRPGVIGKVGTILGDNRINVAGFNLGRESYQGSALGFVSLDSRIPEGVLEEIRGLPEILEAREIIL